MTLRKRQFLSASSNISKQDFLSKQQIFSLKKDKLEKTFWGILAELSAPIYLGLGFDWAAKN